MSARNYLSLRDKNIGKLYDCLPSINQQKFAYRAGPELPPLSANKPNTSKFVNRNLNYSYDLQNYRFNSLDRAGTPFSDFFSESESGTPDFRSEESDSSAGSALQRNTEEATRILSEEWERIERTLYNEDGEKSTRPQIIEECKQWRHLHPQFRIIGKGLPLPEKRLSYRQVEHDEVIIMHYSDYEQFSESEERLSESSSDITPQNSPRVSVEDLSEPRLMREKVTFSTNFNKEQDMPDSFCSLLHITPLQIHSPAPRKRQNQSIVRSEVASSRWMRGSRPESSNCGRNSAKSFVSLDFRTYGNLALSASDRNNLGRVVTARHNDLTRLEPLHTPELSPTDASKLSSTPYQYGVRKVSLPPLFLEEERKKVAPVNSAKKHYVKTRKHMKSSHFDKVKNNH